MFEYALHPFFLCVLKLKKTKKWIYSIYIFRIKISVLTILCVLKLEKTKT